MDARCKLWMIIFNKPITDPQTSYEHLEFEFSGLRVEQGVHSLGSTEFWSTKELGELTLDLVSTPRTLLDDREVQ